MKIKQRIKHIKYVIVLMMIQIGASVAFSQETRIYTELPDEAVATEDNKKLIDSLLKVSKFDLYFTNYAKSKIRLASYEKKWSKEEITARESRINTQKFVNYTVYNALSSLTSEELLQLIPIMEKLNKDEDYSGFIISNSIIANNMESYIKGHYLE